MSRFEDSVPSQFQGESSRAETGKLTPAQFQRLAFSKYVLELGLDQAKRQEPLGAPGLLLIHDAVELLNRLAAECWDAKLKSQPDFLDYWDALGNRIAPHALPERLAMQRLNKARVALKHHGNLPSRSDLASFCESGRRYFHGALPVLFGLEYHDLSLADFVECAEAKERLKLAQQSLAEANMRGGFEHVAVAFFELVKDFDRRTSDEFGRPLQRLPKERHASLGSRLAAAAYGSRAERELQEVLANVDRLNESVRFLAFGIDLRKLGKFRKLTPHVSRSDYFSWGTQLSESPEDLQFCIDFALESALRFQTA